MANGSPGAPSKLDNGLIIALSNAISAGNYLETACHLCHFQPKYAYEWLKIAESDSLLGATESESIFIKFRNAINEASAINENQLVGVIKSSAIEGKNWLPAITFLERRHPDRWGRRDRTKVDISETRTIKITHVEYNLAGGERITVVDGATNKELPIPERGKEPPTEEQRCKAIEIARHLIDEEP